MLGPQNVGHFNLSGTVTTHSELQLKEGVKGEKNQIGISMWRRQCSRSHRRRMNLLTGCWCLWLMRWLKGLPQIAGCLKGVTQRLATGQSATKGEKQNLNVPQQSLVIKPPFPVKIRLSLNILHSSITNWRCIFGFFYVTAGLWPHFVQYWSLTHKS